MPAAPMTSPALPIHPGRPSRRVLLAGALGGLAAAAASMVGAPRRASGAVGDPILAGMATGAGSATTSLSNNSGTNHTLVVTQNGTSTAIRGESDAGVGGRFRTENGARSALIATQGAANYAGGYALEAHGNQNNGILVTSQVNYAITAEAPSYIAIKARGLYGIDAVAEGGGTGIHGTSATNTGVVGTSTSSRGVSGDSNSGHGVRGTSSSSVGTSGRSISGVAVHGLSTDQTGVSGQSTNWIGVYGQGGSYAGWFQGDINVTGSVDSPAQTVVLDHPGDAANRTLSHAALVSDGLKAAYSGSARTDAAGRATVQLPAYAAALVEGLSYQLTVVGGRGSAWVEREMDGGRFVIGSDPAGVRVDWQVIGTRRDAWARAHPLAVEADKGAAARGTYLAPVEHGQPASRGRDYLRLQGSLAGPDDD